MKDFEEIRSNYFPKNFRKISCAIWKNIKELGRNDNFWKFRIFSGESEKISVKIKNIH